MRTAIGIGAALSVTLALAGCASAPEPNEDLEAARVAVDAAKADQRVVEHAAVQLQEAQEDLAQAEALAADRGESVLVSHYAYLAAREAEAASAIGETGALKEDIEDANEARDQVRLSARERETDQAHDEAALARAQTAEMAQRLAELQAKETERGLVLTLQDVLFDVDGAELKPGAYHTIQDLAAFMADYADRRVRIEGFTDSTGPDEYNRQLSENRAFAVRDALMAAGVAPERIDVHGYGEQLPIASNDTDEGRQLNRRVEIVISDEAGAIAAR